MDHTRQAAELFFKGLEALGSGQLGAAEAAFEAALRLAPGRPSVLANLSIVNTRMGRLERALPLAEAAVAAEPANPLFLMQLGAVQLGLGKPRDALRSFDGAIAADPSIAEIHNARGNALKDLRLIEDALDCYEAAIELKPDHVEAHGNRGNALKQLGRYDDALASYHKAISLRPGHAETHNNLGNLLNKLGRHAEALASYDTAIRLRPGYPDALSNRANVLRELGRIDEAVAGYRQAIALKPDLPEPWLGLGRIDSETGRFAQALENYGMAHDLNPDLAEALCGIAENKRFSDGDPLLPEFERLLASDSVGDEDRSRLHHAYAKVSNDIGRYDDAMAQFAAGKRLLTSSFDAGAVTSRYDALMTLFDRSFFAARTSFGLPDVRPVFVVGMPRSGTTLTEQILASHHRIIGLGECPDLPRIASQLGGDDFDPARFAAAVAALGPGDVRALAERYCQVHGAAAAGGEARLFVDKQPHNFEWLGLIALMFPNACIIHCSRDPLDTCVSMYMQKFSDAHGYNRDLATLGRYYRDYQRLMQHWQQVLPLPIHSCAYEDIVARLEPAARELIAFVGLDWDPACLDFHLHDRRVDTPSRWQVRQPIYDRSVGRWRRYERHLGPLKLAMGLV